MKFALAGDDVLFATLREQAECAIVQHREPIHFGFWTNFSVPDDVPRVYPPAFVIHDINLEISNLACGASLQIFVRDGKITSLEVSSAQEWPTNAEIISMSYLIPKSGVNNEIVSSKERDITFAKKWAGITNKTT